MSTKTFCDCCGKDAAWTRKFRIDGAGVVSLYTEDEEKDTCLYCAIDGLKKLDDRAVAVGSDSLVWYAREDAGPASPGPVLACYGNGNEHDYRVLFGNEGVWRDEVGRKQPAPRRWAYLP